jgi:hypothetical protein
MPRREGRSVPVASGRTRPGRDLPACFATTRTILEPAAQSPDLSGKSGRGADAGGHAPESAINWRIPKQVTAEASQFHRMEDSAEKRALVVPRCAPGPTSDRVERRGAPDYLTPRPQCRRDSGQGIAGFATYKVPRIEARPEPAPSRRSPACLHPNSPPALDCLRRK